MAGSLSGKQESLQKAEMKMAELLKGKSPEVIGFYNSMKQSGKTSSWMTRRNYTYSVIKFVDAIKKPVTEIGYDDIISYMNAVSSNENGTLKTGSYMRTVYAALKRFFTYLYRSGKVKSNYMEFVDRPAKTPTDQVVRVSLTKEEFNKCKTYTRESNNKFSVRDELIMAIFITTGIRVTALVQINIEDINDNVLRIIDKGNKYREFYLSDQVMELLKLWMRQRSVLVKNTNALFISSRGTRITQDGVRKAMTNRCNTTGKHITPHKFRRSCATWLSDDGSSLYEIQQFIGHASPQTTEIYLQNKEKAASKAGNIARNFY